MLEEGLVGQTDWPCPFHVRVTESTSNYSTKFAHCGSGKSQVPKSFYHHVHPEDQSTFIEAKWPSDDEGAQV